MIDVLRLTVIGRALKHKRGLIIVARLLVGNRSALFSRTAHAAFG
jgi:hypothetical protein